MIKRIVSKFIKQKLGLPNNKKEEAMMLIFPALKAWNKVTGNYLEFGVYKGTAFIEAMYYAKKYGFEEMHFFAFDSFEGLPEIIGSDDKHEHFKKGQYINSIESFEKTLKKHNAPRHRITLTKGYFDNTLNNNLKEKLDIGCAAIIWIDCDLYDSTVPVLNFITDYLVSGTFLVFDDWFSFAGDSNAGEIRATNEWLEKNLHISLVHYKDFGASGKIFIVQKK